MFTSNCNCDGDFCSGVIVFVICNKIWPNYHYFFSNNCTEFEKTQKSKTIVTPSNVTLWPTTTPQSLSGTQHDRTHGSH